MLIHCLFLPLGGHWGSGGLGGAWGRAATSQWSVGMGRGWGVRAVWEEEEKGKGGNKEEGGEEDLERETERQGKEGGEEEGDGERKGNKKGHG